MGVYYVQFKGHVVFSRRWGFVSWSRSQLFLTPSHSQSNC